MPSFLLRQLIIVHVKLDIGRVPDVLPNAEVPPTTPDVPPKHFTRSEKVVSADSRSSVGLRIAYSHKQFNKFRPRYLKIQLEDLKDYQRALSYIGKLGFYEVQLRCK